MFFVLAQAASAEAVQSLEAQVAAVDGRIAMLLRFVAFVVIVAGLMFGWNVVGAWIAGVWAKIKSDLQPSPRPEEPRFPATARLIAAAQSTAATKSASDSAAQSLLQQISADSSVLSAEMKVEKSNGTLELKFTAKGAAANG